MARGTFSRLLKKLDQYGASPAWQRSRAASRTNLKMELLEDRINLSFVDLQTAGAFGAPNGNPLNGIFRQVPPQPTGTGVIQPFVRMQTPNGQVTVEHGYNTSTRPVQFNENTDPNFTRNLTFASVPRVNIGGRMYLEFLLDVNEPGGGNGLVSLDELRLFASNSPLFGYSCTGTAPTQVCTLGGAASAFNLDGALGAAPDDNWVHLNARLNSGSGSGDMIAYLPLPTPAFTATYLHLYSKFGVNRTADGGFEEWAHGTNLLTPATGSICGTQFHDRNMNNVRDANEEVLAGWTVYLDANNNGVQDADEVSTTTGADGGYCFTNLATGMGTFSTYVVRHVPQSGWTTSAGAAGYVVALDTPGQAVTGRDFGDFSTYAISGRIFEDMVGDRSGTGDPGRGGFRVNLYRDANSNGMFDAGTDPLAAFTTTAADTGAYAFPFLTAGTYFVDWDPTNLGNHVFVQTFPTYVEVGTSRYTVAVSGAPGTVFANRDFGYFICAEIEGRVFIDTNADGVWNAGESAFDSHLLNPRPRIRAFRDANSNGVYNPGTDPQYASQVIESSVMDFGHACFLEGTYFILIDMPPGYVPTGPQPMPLGYYTVTVQSGGYYPNRNFGIFPAGKISGTKFDDLNGNGTRDTGEPGLANWSINLTGSATRIVTTDANGYYEFNGLYPGSYSVSEVQQSGWVQTAGPASYSVTVAGPGVNVANQNFGNFRLFSISGRFFEDILKDGSGVGDPGYNGRRFDLHRDADGNGIFNLNLDPLVLSTETATVGEAGFFSFANLGPGTYFVRRFSSFIPFVPNLPPGVTNFVWTAPAVGLTYTVVGQSGVNVTNRDFGIYRCANFTGRVFVDANGDGDGTSDPTYNVAAGVPVYYYRDSNGNGVFDPGIDAQVGETLGEASGISFHGCSSFDPGRYFFTAVIPTGFVQTAPAAPGVVTHVVQSGTTGSVLFGIFQRFAVSGVLFEDHNGNGLREGGGNDTLLGNADDERALAGWTVYHDANNNGTWDGGPLEPSAVTDANGVYQLADLGPGTYRIRAVAPAGWTRTAGNHDFTGASGLNLTGRDFGFRQVAFATGEVFTQGFWQRNTASWPVASLILGTVSYTSAQAQQILNQPSGDNGLIALAQRLIAAKLNVANGVIPSAAVQADLTAADTLIGARVVPPIGTDTLTTAVANGLIEALTAFNEKRRT